MATGWYDISARAFYGDFSGYIRFANQLFRNDGEITASTSNAMRIFDISENSQYRVTMQMRNRFRLGCLPTLTTGQTVTNYIFDPLDNNDATDQGGAVRSLEITSEAGQLFLIVGAWSSGASASLLDTLNTIVVEQWLTYFTVIFQDWDGTLLKTETVIEHEAATAPANPVRAGYIFTGWDVAFDDVTEDLTVAAQYRTIGTYSVTFKNYDDTTLKTEYVLEGGAATPPTVPDREGYDHSGWDVPFDNVLADIITTAQFTPKVYHTVRFLDWDEDVLKTELVEHGCAATPPDSPIRAGYHFVGWDSPCSEILSDLDVHALYTQIIYFTVTFEDWDMTVLKTEQVEHGQAATAPANPTRSGYTFIGWDKPFTNIQAATTVTALYERIIVYHTVTFLDYNGTVLKTEQVEDGYAAMPPLPPMRTGYIFDHWDNDFSEVTADLAVTAVYRAELEHTVIKIYSSSYALVQTVDRVLSATYRDSLDGELTFDFSTLAGRGNSIQVGGIAEYEGCYFNIVRVAKTISSGLMTVAVTCEHISYVLNDDRYKINAFDFTGPPSAGLARLLSGTQFVVGSVDFTAQVTMKINTEVTRREALMQFIAILGGEIEYDGHYINVRRHRGNTTVKQLMESKNVTDVSVTYDSRAATASYDIAFHKIADCEVGDEVRIVFSPLGVNTTTRIIAMEYNPFYRYSIRVEVGDYKPTINDSLYRIEKTTSDNSDDMSEIWDTFDDFSSDFDSFETDYGNFLSTYKEVQNIAVGSTSFAVTFTDGTAATYNYTIDAQGRMTSITKAV